MTETQAQSGTASAESGPALDDSVAPSAPAGGQGAGGSGSDAGAPAGSDGSGASGRASVPGERTTGGTPKFTRAPGMVPPPDSLTVPIQAPTHAPLHVTGKASVVPGGVSVGGVPVNVAPMHAPPMHAPPSAGFDASATQPVSAAPAGPAVARATVRGSGASLGASQTGTINLTGLAAGAPAAGAARVTEAVRAARKTVSAAVGRGPRRARLHLKRIDPWSVMKFSFAVSFVLLIVIIVATSVLWLALDAMGVFQSVNKTLADMIGATGGDNAESFQITAKSVLIGAGLLGLVNVVLFTALATLGAFIYNVCADLVGGIELTLAEKD
jgi:hypothetical protein